MNDKMPDTQHDKILIVEDDDATRDMMGAYLQATGFTVHTACDGTEMRNAVTETTFDVILLDRNLPDSDGLELLRELNRTTSVKIIIISEMGSPENRAEGLEFGAADYIAKPVYPRELLARIRNVMRTASSNPAQHTPSPKVDTPTQPPLAILTFGNWILDGVNRLMLTVDGHDAQLTPAEFDLLYYLASHPGQLLERKILAQVASGGKSSGEDSRSVDILISRLRTKLSDGVNQVRYIETSRGYGYRFTQDVERQEG